MENNVTSKLVSAAIESARSGDVCNYYRAEAKWQGEMRGRFAAFAEASSKIEGSPEEALSLLSYLNRAYNTRHTTAQLPWILEACTTSGMSEYHRHLAHASETGIIEIATIYVTILKLIAQKGEKRPFSLLSKWLHMLHPSTFVIYDQQAAASIKAWSDLANAHLAPKHPDRLQFDVENSFWVRNWDNPGWYAGILNFYKECLRVAETNRMMNDLADVAAHLQEIVRQASGHGNARVTIIDVIDTHIWKAKGDPQRLGLV